MVLRMCVCVCVDLFIHMVCVLGIAFGVVLVMAKWTD